MMAEKDSMGDGMRKMNFAVGSLWLMLLLMGAFYFAVAIVGVVSDRSGANVFYSKTIDATCIESFERGRTAMFCFHGDLREEFE